MKTIFCNYYSWLSLGMILLTILFSVDFGKMREFEKKAQAGELEVVDDVVEDSKRHGKVADLLLPVVALIVLSIVSMLYTGGFFAGSISIGDAFADCDAILGLAMGAAYTVIFVALLYLPRKIVTPKEFVDGLVQGFINMVPATLILTFAWTLSGICGGDYLNAGGFVAGVVSKYSISLNLMPAIFFVIALLLAFSTGTSWGTFAILLPITVSVFGDQLLPLTVITTAAVLGGAVCGDHISPISDTTILSSTGAGCSHINHVSTQMQYGLIAAAMSVVCYVVSGITESTVAGFITGAVVLVAFVLCAKVHYQKNN
jgi:Na+/H+ antiporter NhaC